MKYLFDYIFSKSACGNMRYVTFIWQLPSSEEESDVGVPLVHLVALCIYSDGLLRPVSRAKNYKLTIEPGGLRYITEAS
jgi:hypothetical protein